jgi:nitrile hydratase accessory protein
VTDLLPGQPEVDGEPVFREPWEAHAFAMAVQLHERGLFTWPEWAEALSAEIAGGSGDGATYYHAWLSALERLVDEKGGPDRRSQARAQEAWRRAAARTPHGHPIDLRPSDFP